MRAAWLLAVLALAGCSDDSSSGGGAGGGSGSDGGDAAGGAAGAESCQEPVGPDAAVPKPAPADIQFSATNALPKGEQILFNDWTPLPNVLSSIRPDGTGELEVFRAYRIWSLASANDGRTLAFACGDPNQEQNYGITIGDAIQHTWLYDVATQAPSVLTWGNLNDECHTFSASDDALWVCRRWDFSAEGTSKGYQITRVSVPCGRSELVTTPGPNQLELHPRPTPDGSALYYTLIEIAAGKQTRNIVRKALPGGSPEPVRPSATLAALSPDGQRLVFADHTQAGALFSMRLDGSDVIQLSTHSGTNAVYSPDGTRIAYLWDETQTCHHVEVVAADGSQAASPVRVRDCQSAFITELAWLNVP